MIVLKNYKHSYMKQKINTIYLLFLLLGISSLNAQNNVEDISLKQGSYQVGFRHYTRIDSSRTYQIRNEYNNSFINRPIPISIWFPLGETTGNAEPITVYDYLNILKEEEEWENLPNEFLMDWFKYLWNTDHNRAQLPKKMNAFRNAKMISGKFPVVVYAPSYQASSIENFVLCEYLASQGYIVISSPSRGTDIRQFDGGTTRDMETQSTDIAFLIKELNRYESANLDKIALMGFSFGGLSNFITAIKNRKIKALISLDGTERYNYPVLEKSPYFLLDRFKIPYVHFAQKEIPQEVLRSDNMPKELNSEFQLYDALKFSNVYRYRFHDLSHSYFSSFGVVFTNRDKRQDKEDDKIAYSYKVLCEYTLAFLKAMLNEDVEALEFMENTPFENGHTETLLTKRSKKAIDKEISYLEFNDMANAQQYKNLIPLYQNVLQQNPQLILEEGMLNYLGLRLSFDPQRIDMGINVFKLALYIYPKSANLYDSLAEAYFYNKDLKSARINFEKSLKLNPGNGNAKKRIEQIKKM